MTLNEIKSAVAAYFGKTVADLTVSEQDLFLTAVNQVRRQAELLHDFEFSRKLVTVTVDGSTGGSLDSAVDSAGSSVDVKTVIDCALLDNNGDLRPVDWTTVSESLDRQREDNPHTTPRYPTDAWAQTTALGTNRFTFSGQNIYRFPLDADNDFTLKLEVYAFQADWTGLSSTVTVSGTLSPNVTGVYTRHGEMFGYPVYLKGGSEYALYYSTPGWLLIDDGVKAATVTTNLWTYTTTAHSPAGTYTAEGTATGTATVALTTSDDDYWTKYGHQYLLWGTIVLLNHRFKTFVYRQEGNLAPPEKLRDEGLAAFVEWDNFKYEQFRRRDV